MASENDTAENVKTIQTQDETQSLSPLSPLDLGDELPNLNLALDGGKTLSFATLLGQPVVIYLYPKDDTSGCTKEAQDFQAKLEDFERHGVRVLGLSKDSVKSHDKFKAKYGLSFPLISDEDCTLISALGSWVQKSMYGRSYMGADRSTFLFNKDGKLAKIWRKVKVPGHVDQVLKAITELKN